MTHPRKIIRDSVTSAVIGLNTAAADRVWPSREPPINVEAILMDQGPVVLVYTRHDRSPKDGYSPQGFGWVKREVTLYIEITAAGASVLDDKLDAMAEDVESLMDSLVIAEKPSWEFRHVETMIDTSTEFETPIGGALLEYEVCYWREWRPEPEEESFPCTADVGVKVNGGPREQWPMGCDDCEP